MAKSVALSFDRASQSYDDEAVLQRELAHALVHKASVGKDDDVLDVGAGTGFCLEAFAGDESRWDTIDVAPSMVSLLQEKFPKARALVADVHDLPFEDECFDKVLSSMALQWCNLERSAKEALRVLRPGGSLHACIPIDPTFCELCDALSVLFPAARVKTFSDASRVKALPCLTHYEEKTHQEHYDSLYSLLSHIKKVGALHGGSLGGIMTKKSLAMLDALYRKRHGKEYPLTYRIAFFSLVKKSSPVR